MSKALVFKKSHFKGSLIALEIAGSVSEHQRVAITISLEGLDRRRFVDHAGVVQQHERPWLGQREALAIRAIGGEHAGLATTDALPAYQQGRNEIHASP